MIYVIHIYDINDTESLNSIKVVAYEIDVLGSIKC